MKSSKSINITNKENKAEDNSSAFLVSENKKILNSCPNTFDNINFKSRLETTVYKQLLKEGVHPSYEKEKFIIWKGFRPSVPYFHKLNKLTITKNMKIQDITYTPDFIFNYGKYKVILEVKGYANDVFSYKFKMFRRYLEEHNGIRYNYILALITNKKVLIEFMDYLKELNKEDLCKKV